MDSDSIYSIIAIICLVLLSAFFSASETAYSSLNTFRMRHLAKTGDRRAELVLKLAENYDKLLSSILVGNNIVNITAASVGTVFFVKHFQAGGATISTIVITVVVLIFGEISPKSMAKESPERFAMFSAQPLRFLIWLLTPVNFLFSLWKKLLSKLFKSTDDPSITEEELLTIVDEAEQEGAIDDADKQLINSVIEFNDLKAVDIFTPRVDVDAVSKDASLEFIKNVFLNTGYSRLPVYEETIDSIIGVIHLRDFFELSSKKNKALADILSPVVYITPGILISELLKLLQSSKNHMAVVTDEYGGTLGIVTMEDILEELVGEIWDEHDEIVEEFTLLEDGSYKIVCNTDVDKLFEMFDIESETESSTVSGWIMEQLGKIPEEGDSFNYDNLTVTVHKTDRNRALESIILIN